MANCAVCSVELKFLNTPLLGAGKLATGETICVDCRGKLKLSEDMKVGRLTLDEVKSLLLDEQNVRSHIDEQLARLDLKKLLGSDLFIRKELKALSTIIDEDEEIASIVQGNYNDAHGIFLATDRRFIFVDKGIIGSTIEEFDLEDIASIDFEAGPVEADIIIMTHDEDEILISNVNAAAAELFCEQALELFETGEEEEEDEDETEEQARLAPQVVIAQVDVADQLLKLSHLVEQGILTKEEFDVQKKKLLNM